MNEQPYWLCCGSTDREHASARKRNCLEAHSGHPEHCRWGTRTQHREWLSDAHSRESSVSATDFIKAAKRDAEIIGALHIARYALVTHSGLTIRCEGEEWKADFEEEISKIDAVMTMLGVDLTQPLPAPVNWRTDEDQ